MSKESLRYGYRPDIDGLRAVAVLLVVLFHLELGVSGGYVGVDVFFVISGFLITGIIDRQFRQGRFSFLEFYERRARRILPAMLVVLLASSFAAAALLLPSDLSKFGDSAIATLLFSSNFWFWSQASYFAPSSDMAPLLHTWTLAVEEQFYIVLPVSLLFCYRVVKGRVALALLAVFLVSFISAAWFISTRAQEVFYLSPFRAWELLLGSLMAVGSIPRLQDNVSRELVAAAGLALILYSGFAYDVDTAFPGPAALLPCGGAAMVIWSGMSGGSRTASLLSTRALVFIGLISYSLYLWHWPLLVFTRHYLNRDFDVDVRIILGVSSIALAAMSWWFVERPFRRKEVVSTRKFISLAMCVTGVGAGAASLFVFSNGLPSRFMPQVVELDRQRTNVFVRNDCLNPKVPFKVSKTCPLGLQGNPNVLVWGDSYAFAMLPALDAAFRNIGISAIFLARTGCPPFPGSEVSLRGRNNWRCTEFNQNVMRMLTESGQIEHIVLAAAWNAYADENQEGYRLDVVDSGASGSSFESSASNVIGELSAMSGISSITVIEQVPSYESAVPYQMALALARGSKMKAMTLAEHKAKTQIPHRVFASLAESNNVNVIRPEDWFCASGICRYADKMNRPYYFDHGHLNARGAAFIEPHLEVALRGDSDWSHE